MKTALEVLDAQTAEKAIEALLAIKYEIQLDALKGSQIDYARQTAAEASQARKHLEEGARRALDLYRRWSPDDAEKAAVRRRRAKEIRATLPPGASLRDGAIRERMLFYARVLRAAKHDPLFRYYATVGRQRREARGNPENIWIRRAKVVLKNSGVPESLHLDLLRAIGLVRPVKND